MTDILLGTLHDPFHKFHMGITAENLAEKYEITREQQDAYALESHRRASAAIKAGYFRDQIVGYELKTRKGVTVFAEDEHVRHDAKLEDMSNLRPAFKKEGGTVTAGNASGINDGAAAVVLASGEAVKKYGLTPMARLVSYAHAGVDPAFMGIGPVPATKTALAKAGLSVGDMGVIESNEAFAAQACAVSKVLEFDPAKVNPNGSGISLGHPVGATGAINTVKIVHEMQRTQARYGLVTMCIGGGQGIAAIWERV
jgi:acetyl-CoA C-acetyltransferase